MKTICFEPDFFNASRCQKKIDEISERNDNYKGYLVNNGTWNQEGEIAFDNGAEYESKIVSEG